MKQNKVVHFFKRNWKKAVAVAGAAMVGGALYVTKRYEVVTIIRRRLATRDLPIPEISTGEVRELWTSGNSTVVNAIVNNVRITDLGAFGGELAENVAEITPDMTVDAILGIGVK